MHGDITPNLKKMLTFAIKCFNINNDETTQVHSLSYIA
jgi:hypothetical protein